MLLLYSKRASQRSIRFSRYVDPILFVKANSPAQRLFVPAFPTAYVKSKTFVLDLYFRTL